MSAPLPAPGSATDPATGHPPSSREAALHQLLRRGEATAADLAQSLGISVQVMRRHLRSLEEEHLVEASPSPDGPGRPSNRWRLSAAGHSHFHDGSEHFALGLLQSLAQTLPPETIQGLMNQQALAKASDYRGRIGDGPLAQRLERLVEIRRAEGFVAELDRDPADPAAEAWVISEFHCSVMRIAEEFPMVCDQELKLIGQTFPDCQVERVHWRLEEGHSCGFRLRPRLPASGAQAPSDR